MCYILHGNQRAFLVQMTSFVVRYDVIYHSFPINSQYLMTLGVDSPAKVQPNPSPFYIPFYIHGSYNLQKVLNFTSRLQNSLNSV